MSLARTPDPVDDVGGDLIRTHPSAPLTVTVVVPTRPGGRLRAADRRRLARRVLGAERRLARMHPPSSTRTRVVRRLRDLLEQAELHTPAAGLALVAGPLDGRCVVLRQPVLERVLIGRAPSYDDLIRASWGLGRVAVLHLVPSGGRLVCAEGARLWETGRPSGVGDRDPDEPSVLAVARELLSDALPGRTPVVVAGDDRCVRAFAAHVSHPAVSLVLPGDHSETSMATLAALAQRAVRRSLEPDQLDAMAAIALAVERGTAARGVDAVTAAVSTVGTGVGTEAVLVVEAGARSAVVDGDDETIVERAARGGIDVVVVADGLLAAHDRIALVPLVGAVEPPVAPLHAVP